MSQVHDTLFRWAFSDTPRVVCLLRSVLPTALVAMVDWGAVEKVPIELLDKDLSEKRSDLVWSLPMRGRTITLHLILEHQSWEQRFMGLRVLDYARAVWQWWLDRNPRARSLPPVVGLVVSHDPDGWQSPTQLWDALDSDPALEAALGACLVDVGFLLEDLQKRSDQDIRSWAMDEVGKLTLLLLKHGRGSPGILGLLETWRELFVWEQVEQALPRLVWYLLVVREDATAQQLHQLFSEMLGKRAGEVVMTEAERLIAQGEERGLQKGLQQGLQPIFRQIEIRLHRPLLDTERTRLVERLDEVGPDRIGEVTLELSPEELARWLADPNAR
jgi:predicted transposase YdaD